MSRPATTRSSSPPDSRRATSGQPAGAELADLLSTGPFAAALRAAIRARGLSLQRLQRRLHERGVPISVTALSYWQSGRRRPERPESLAALRHLEDVLDLPVGTLGSLLGPPRPRGRTATRTGRALPVAALWRDRRVAALVAGLDTTADSALTRISQHDQVEIGADRSLRAVRVRQVLRAERDAVDRWVLVFHGMSSANRLPEVRPVRSARLGRLTSDPALGLLAAELLFPRPLRRGETTVVEYELVHTRPGPHPDDTFCRKFRLPVREYLVEVRFAPAALPVRCLRQAHAPDGRPLAPTRIVAVAEDGFAHAVVLDFGPGSVELRWEWPADPAQAAPTSRTTSAAG
ncbi:hypothetical protein [Goodfellowiella coeruleoviolacea]|uniref:Uncharacterized protein n=1 Tax=Goodfellowiella coeruleoviolacea TaxID=334858 RepID=A0AAE3GE66_9PSEU|nr:hypothetical protein [Goodfellowiella coeruleoviolacea]MCP2166646.1 hypothetical protein [Goodfellowiella coeruleoviolacea]